MRYIIDTDLKPEELEQIIDIIECYGEPLDEDNDNEEREQLMKIKAIVSHFNSEPMSFLDRCNAFEEIRYILKESDNDR